MVPEKCTGGQWVAQAACAGATSVCLSGACVACQPNAARCMGQTLQSCTAAGAWMTTLACASTCMNSTCYTATGCVEPIPVGGTLPYVVDSDFLPSGYEGDIADITEAADKTCGGARSSATAKGNCYTWTYAAPTPAVAGYAAVLWQYPVNNFGTVATVPGYPIPPGATKVSFWAKGKVGGEKVSFAVGQIPATAKCSDAIIVPLALETLTAAWVNYTIALPAQSYATGEITGFVWDAAAQGAINFYLDDIEWQM
jgi:hypothetical protein